MFSKETDIFVSFTCFHISLLHILLIGNRGTWLEGKNIKCLQNILENANLGDSEKYENGNLKYG